MQKFLDDLENELNERNCENKDELLEKYRKRYEFGLESGLTNAEIEEMLGSPKKIVDKFGVFEEWRFKEDSQEESFKEETKEDYISRLKDLSISLTADDLEIMRDDVDDIRIKLIDLKKENYNIIENEKCLSISSIKKTSGLFSKNKGKIQIIIPYNFAFNKININLVSGTSKICRLDANSFDLKVVSGNITIESIEAFDVKLNSVSGFIKGDLIECNRTTINSVSGNIDFKEIKGYNLACETITGVITVSKTNCSIKRTVLLGSITINKGDENNE